MNMEQSEYAALYAVLDDYSRGRCEVSLNSLHAGGILSVSRKLRRELEQFEMAVAARAKAEFESARGTLEQVASDFGEGFDSIEIDQLRRVVHVPSRTAK